MMEQIHRKSWGEEKKMGTGEKTNKIKESSKEKKRA